MKAVTFLGISTLASSALAAVPLPLFARQTAWTVGQAVDTSSGRVTGHAAKNASQVSEYLGIRFGKAPIGDLRFAKPEKFENTADIDGTKFGASCPVRPSNGSSTYTTEQLNDANVTAAAFAVVAVMSNTGANYSEDCLFLNVWTKPQTGEAKKAVMVWLYGGGFTGGSSSIAGYNGANLVEEQDVIIVSLNYRLNVLGFPGNPDSPNNLALYDQRLGVEWVRDNIEKFGGDPKRITIFGQSAGSASVDLYNYAWKDDPIAAGFIPESGIAYGWGLPNSKARSASFWYNVTSTLGCGNSSTSSAEVLSCMRRQNYSDILTAVPQLGDTDGILGGFGPTADEEIVFSNYTGRAPSNVPLLIGNTDYEGGYFRLQFAFNKIFYSDNFWNGFNLLAFTCPTANRANASVAAGIPTWRYRYMGVFPNLAISKDAGAWHASEIPMIFNTAPGAATTAQIAIGKYMRGAWTAFAKNPASGLETYGWPKYDVTKDTLVRIAYNNLTGPNLINPYRYDADCIFFPNISDLSQGGGDRSQIPQLPDLGASVTPTGSSNGTIPTATGTPSASTTPTRAATNAGSHLSSSIWVVFMGALAAFLL